MAGHLFLLLILAMFFYGIEAALALPKLTVTPSVITDTDSVTLHCETPSSVSQCFFYAVSKGSVRQFSCLQTLTGSELLKTWALSSPAEVEVRCFYTVKSGASYSASERSSTSSVTVHTLPLPKLTVTPSVITDTDLVTLHCQTPSSVSQCFFYAVSKGSVREFSCRQTLTGSELLKTWPLHLLSSPAEVEVRCYYTVESEGSSSSEESNTASITVHTLPLPKLTVTPSVITDADLVTLRCETPSSESQCFFYAVSKAVVRQFSCLRTLTGSELLKTWALSSPAEVEVRCYYTVKSEGSSSSEESNTASVTINRMRRPEMSVQHFPGEHVDFVCSLPGSADEDTKCNLYIGEASRPVETRAINSRENSKNQSFCIFSLTIDDLLRYLHWVQQSEASCDYSFGRKTNSLSPRSDGYSLTDTTVISPDASTFVFPVSPTTDLTFHGSSTGLNTVTPQKSASALPLPKLTVTRSVITDADLVTLRCETPSSVSQCFFYAVSKAVVRQFSCLQTLTGSELLKTWALSSPAEVEVRCFYTLESEGSEHSNTVSVTVHRMRRPEMSVQHFPGEHVDFVCSLPGSADKDTKCNLYIGDASQPVEARSINHRENSKNQSFCIFSFTIDDLLRYLHWVKPSEASCDYSFGRKTNSLSPRSDGYSLTDILKNESNHSPPQAGLTTTTDILKIESNHSPSQAALTTTIDTTVISPDASTFVFPVSPTTDLTFHGSSTGLNTVTPQKSASETAIWILVLSVAGFGVTMGIITMGLTLFCTKRRTEKCSDKRTKDTAWDEPVLGTNVDCGESVMCQPSAAGGGYSVITSVPGAVHPPAPETVNKQMLQRTLSDHCYAYITFEGPSVQHREGTNESLV
ncbi:uncharacterized protein V6R79_016405 [Siganus canaliculatus]